MSAKTPGGPSEQGSRTREDGDVKRAHVTSPSNTSVRTVGTDPLPREGAESVSTDDREYYHGKRLRSLQQVICA